MPITTGASSLTDDVKNDSKNNKASVRRRSKGEKTKEKILLATIDVLAINGIKGTTHRAIAAQAELQLSLTTYYFKDIQELVQQAFTLNCQNTSTASHHLFASAFSLIESYEKKELRKVSVKEGLCDKLTEIIGLQLFNRVTKQSTPLLVEQFLFSETKVTTDLLPLTQKHKQALLLPYEQFCQYFNKVDPELDAQILFSFVTQLQHQLLIEGAKNNSDEFFANEVYRPLRKVLAWIMRTK